MYRPFAVNCSVCS